jgi:predicted nucleotidyltransferase
MNAQSQIKKLCNQIVDKFRPQKVILFGSYAYGKPNYDSDIDLLVIMPYVGRNHDQAVAIRRSLDSAMPIDLLVRTAEQVQERIDMEDFFMREIVRDGKVLYEKDHA